MQINAENFTSVNYQKKLEYFTYTTNGEIFPLCHLEINFKVAYLIIFTLKIGFLIKIEKIEFIFNLNLLETI